MNYLYNLQCLREGALSFLNPFFITVSEGGFVLGMVLILCIYWAIDKNAGKKLIFSFGFAQFFTNFIKDLACISRPWIRDSRLFCYSKAVKGATGYSFPSGHSTLASSCYGGIALWKRKNILVSVLFFVMTFLIMFSRNWLGCHTLQDVLTGFSVGIIFACLSLFLFDKIEGNKKASLIFLIISLLIIVIFDFIVFVKPYPNLTNQDGEPLIDIFKMKAECVRSSGILVGILLGWFCEKQFLNFSIPEGKIQKIIVIVIGSVVTLYLHKYAFKVLFKPLGFLVSETLNSILSFYFATFIYPLIFSSILKKLK